MLDAQMLLKQARLWQEDAVCIYRRLHMYPELAHQETETHAYLRQELERLDIPFLSPSPNITIALVDSGKPGGVVGLRCDTDALPVQEETGLPFASRRPGIMHACGHDAHMTIGLMAARLLMAFRESWEGRVKVIFQPAEEGEAGADEVIATGLVNDVDAFFGLHVWSAYETGTLHVSPIATSAAVNMFTLRIHGLGGHGAAPDKCRDALVAGAAVVSALQTVVSRTLSPMEPAVLTLGSFHAGTAGNIIAGEAEIKGTLRTFNSQTRATACEALERIAHQVAEAYGCTAEIDNRLISDALINDPALTALARECALQLVEEGAVQPQRSVTVGDDFASYCRIAPICYLQAGIADQEKQTDYALHNGKFRMDESMLSLCAAWMAACVVRWKKS